MKTLKTRIKLHTRGREQPLVGRTPVELHRQVAALATPAPARVVDARTADVLGEVTDLGQIPVRFPGYALVDGGDHRDDQAKVYVGR